MSILCFLCLDRFVFLVPVQDRCGHGAVPRSYDGYRRCRGRIPGVSRTEGFPLGRRCRSAWCARGRVSVGWPPGQTARPHYLDQHGERRNLVVCEVETDFGLTASTTALTAATAAATTHRGRTTSHVNRSLSRSKQ